MVGLVVCNKAQECPNACAEKWPHEPRGDMDYNSRHLCTDEGLWCWTSKAEAKCIPSGEKPAPSPAPPRAAVPA